MAEEQVPDEQVQEEQAAEEQLTDGQSAEDVAEERSFFVQPPKNSRWTTSEQEQVEAEAAPTASQQEQVEVAPEGNPGSEDPTAERSMEVITEDQIGSMDVKEYRVQPPRQSRWTTKVEPSEQTTEDSPEVKDEELGEQYFVKPPAPSRWNAAPEE
uniref:Uncharacterized protein n=1 Tax=Fibrocapsa japonica TaxID=94617 RepID=A0A7S2XWG9_9STRA